MSKKKKRSFRPRYLDDFKLNEAGSSYEYRGSYMRCSLPEESFRREAAKPAVCAAVSFVLLILAGCMPKTGMEERPLILLPYALALIASAVCVYRSLKIVRSGGALRTYEYKKTVPYLIGWSTAGAVLCILALAGIFMALLLKMFAGSFLPSVFLAAVFCLSGISLGILSQKVRRMDWKEEKNA